MLESTNIHEIKLEDIVLNYVNTSLRICENELLYKKDKVVIKNNPGSYIEYVKTFCEYTSNGKRNDYTDNLSKEIILRSIDKVNESYEKSKFAGKAIFLGLGFFVTGFISSITFVYHISNGMDYLLPNDFNNTILSALGAMGTSYLNSGNKHYYISPPDKLLIESREGILLNFDKAVSILYDCHSDIEKMLSKN